jgi:hypothetical protein
MMNVWKLTTVFLRMFDMRSSWCMVCLAVGLGWSGVTKAQQEDVLVPGATIALRAELLNEEKPQNQELVLVALRDDNQGDEKAEETPGGEYWLGVQVAVLPEITKRQLVLKHGLAVEEVSPGSPAAKAEIKKFDILVQAGDTPLKAVADLVKAVEGAEGKELAITVKRDGESRKLLVTADKRPKSETTVDLVRKKIEAARPELAGEIKQLEEALERLKTKTGKDGFGMYFAKPAIVAPRFELKFDDKFHEFPKDLSVQINKQGGEAAKIHVKRGEQEWNITEKTTSELPEDIRGHVQRMIGNMHGPHGPYVITPPRTVRVSPDGKVEGVLNFTPVAPVAPAAPPAAPKPPAAPYAVPTVPAPPVIGSRTVVARVEGGTETTNAKLDAIMKKLEKLESELESLREKK